MLTRKDIAAMLGIEPDTLRKRYESRPDFPKPAIRLSRKTVRWEPDAVRRWIATQAART